MSNNFEQKFLDAVEKSDIPYLRSYVTGEMYDDPTFSGQKADACMRYIREKQLNIEEPYHENIGEEPVPENESDYNRELFYKQVEYLRQNFAYNERKPIIEKIGKAVFAKKITQETKSAQESTAKSSFNSAPSGRRSSEKKSSPAMVCGLIAVIAAIVAIIAFLCRK